MILGPQATMAERKLEPMAWSSMIGMGAMFVSTICLGIFIQPSWNFEDAKAFGEGGSTEASNVLLQLMMIFLFTALVIWLARKGAAMVIKVVILFALWLSMIYTLLPTIALIASLTGMSGEEPWNFSFWVAPLTSLGLIFCLAKYPEWWVVNTTGILVGSGVIVMLGISFVPILICIFMILAAVYDYWAVHRSKHMLELADTMIDLKLPVVLVAPKDASYSFMEQSGNIRDSVDESESDSIEIKKPKGKGRDALFMGLGDVIFPGLLVISSLTYIPEVGGEINNPFGPMFLGPLLVALGTLVGGLIGYVVLMKYVSEGKAQPGLPLLNGGAILGYIISGLILVGPTGLVHQISFF
tara:strand:- start:2851 stop:3915 length:1065 start_codon:yes stop_codon:yes gene_type:complete